MQLAPLNEKSWSDCDDLELLSQIATGNRVAFQALYMRHYRRIHQFILRMIRQNDMTGEILNDTFFTVWTKAGAFNADSRVSTWIFGICYRKCLKALEYSERWGARRCHNSEVESVLVDRRFWPDSEAAHSQFQHQLYRQMQTLPVEQQVVLELTYFMGFSYSEIAEVADVPVNTVKTRMFHA